MTLNIIKLTLFNWILLCIGYVSANGFGDSFGNADKSLSVEYSVDTTIQVVVMHNGNEVFSSSFGGDYGTPNISFVELIGDGKDDIVIELADAAGFKPMIRLSQRGDKYIWALKDKN